VQGRTTVRDTTPAGVATNHSERKNRPPDHHREGFSIVLGNVLSATRWHQRLVIVHALEPAEGPAVSHVEGG